MENLPNGPLCDVCGCGFKSDFDHALCDPCERWTHRDECGRYDVINDRAYFFCRGCYELDG